MLIPMINRYQLISCLPKGGTVAEIGVWNGENSQAILEQSQPLTLYLIDSWGPTEDPKYKFDPAYGSLDDGERSYNYILNKFSKEINNNQVKVQRGLSSEVVRTFPDNYFDWIYIDADHTYRGALSDLTLYLPKVKDNGFILGHDYTKGEAYGWDFGVIEAVNEVVKKNNLHFLALTLSEGFPSYLLSKQYWSEADTVLFNILDNTKFSLEIDEITKFNFYHDVLNINGNNTVLVKLKEKK